MFEGQTQLLLGEGFYDLWLATLVFAFSASLILLNTYFKSRKTPIGRAALYTSLSSLIWSISISLYTFPEVEKIEFTLGFIFLGVGFMAGVITLLSAYERARIQAILSPSSLLEHNSLPLLVLSFVIIPITIVGIVNSFTVSSSLYGTVSILTAICLVLTSLCLISLHYHLFSPRIRKYFAITISLVGIIILFGYFAIDYNVSFDSILLGGQTTIEEAKGFVFAGVGILLATKKGLKAWFGKVVLSMSVLFVVVLDLITELLYHPAFISHSVAVCFIIISIVQLWMALKNG